MVTDAPTAPEVGVRLVMLGAATTVKLFPLVLTPLAFTTTFPVVAAEGTVATMLLALQLAGVAAVPLNLTVLVPCVAPKFDPAIVTEALTAPEVGDRLVMLGVGSTVKLLPLLATPDTVTTTFPVVAPVGTFATMLVAIQLVMVAVVPLNLTVLVPCVDPKFDPVMVIEAVTAPEAGDKVVIVGAAARDWVPARERRKRTTVVNFDLCRCIRPPRLQDWIEDTNSIMSASGYALITKYRFRCQYNIYDGCEVTPDTSPHPPRRVAD